MSTFSIGIVGYGLNPHAACFEDAAKALSDALRLLGHDVVPVTNPHPGRLIMFGANNTIDVYGRVPFDAIIYNTEQVAAKQVWNVMQNLAQWRRHVVWDYSAVNVAWLKEHGVERAVLCPLGYIPSMTKIEPAEEVVDVLFYGSVNAARREILDALDVAGLTVKRLFGIYGQERDWWIARSKVVLNLHYYEKPIFEIFRVSHLLANRKAVVSEDGGQDAELEDFAARAVALVPRERIVEECCRLVADTMARRDLADRGYEAFRALDLVAGVRAAVEAS